MHRNHKGRHYGHGYGNIYANNVNITNVTNVTNVTQVRMGRSGRSHGGRPPKLARFAHSGGLLDADRALSMNEADFGYEMGKVIAYDAKGAWGAMEGMGRAACGIVGCVGKAIGGTLDAIIRVFE